MLVKMADLGSDVANFYHGRSIFITGASGFVGKVLLEKLLRSCPGITNIYVLIRHKRNADIPSRMEQILGCQLFDALRRDRPSVLQKIVAIEGDMMLPNLGISNDDVALLRENVSVVFHSAATVRFDEPLKQAVIMNILGTKKIVELSRQLPKLSALIHVSTAYCNCQKKVIDEVVYDPPADPEKFCQWVMSMDEETLNRITPSLLGKRPNTYTYTKALAEALFNDMAVGLPAAIVRPSIASWKDPVPGWVDNLNGPTGLMAGIGKGVIKSLICNTKFVCDLIPVDILVNLLIVVGWRAAFNTSNNIIVYNCTSSTLNPVKWQIFSDSLTNYITEHPFKEVMWYPGGAMRTNRLIHNAYMQFTHKLPARLMDLASVLLGKKPFFFKLQEKICKASVALEYFTMNEWKFYSRNVTELQEQLTPEDKELFSFSVSEIVWAEYVRIYFDGIKKYVFKERDKDPTNIKQMYYVHRFGQLLTFLMAYKLLQCWLPSFKWLYMALLSVSLQILRWLPIKN